jgi:hypothetical protein
LCDARLVTNEDTAQPSNEQVLIKLTWLLGLIDEVTARYRARPLQTFGRRGSDMSADDEALGPLAPSYRIGNYLTVALDQLHTARVILQPDPQQPVIVPFIGPYPNIRAALEAAALAVYLMHCDEIVRRQRALTAAWDGVLRNENTIKEECALNAADDKASRSRKTRELAHAMLEIKGSKRAIRNVGQAASIDDASYARALPGFRQIVLEAAEGMPFPATFVRFAWGQVSGMAHPSFERNSNLAPWVSIGVDGQEYAHAPRAELAFMHATIEMSIAILVKALDLASTRGNDLTIRFIRQGAAPEPPDF